MRSRRDILGSVDNQCPVGTVCWALADRNVGGGGSSYSGKSGEEVAGEGGGHR